jgi:HK97 family phage prohead protease
MLTRAFAEPLLLRDGGDGRTLEGVIVPYGVEVPIGYYREQFAAGAFAAVERVVLTSTHPRGGGELPIGVSVELRDDPDAWRGAFHVSETPAGEAVLALARDGVPLGLSVGFVPAPGGDRWNRDRTRVVRTRAAADHVAVVRTPAYPGARVAALRHAGPPYRPMFAIARRR